MKRRLKQKNKEEIQRVKVKKIIPFAEEKDESEKKQADIADEFKSFTVP
jgi:phosphoribosylformylglycinamidine (FGAM) synthase PurS component